MAWRYEGEYEGERDVVLPGQDGGWLVLYRALAGERRWAALMSTYSKTFAHIRRQKAAAYRARKKAAKHAATRK